MEHVTNEVASSCEKEEGQEHCANCNGTEERVLQFSLRVTELCNRDCDYCHYHSNINYKKEDIIKVIDACLEHARYDIPLFYFHGGEPSLHDDMEDILEYIKDKREDAVIEFQTNFDDTEEVMDLLPNIDRLNLSFHFPDDNINEKLKLVKELKKTGKLNVIDLIYKPGFDKDFKKLRQMFNILKIKNEITYSFFQADDYEDDIKKLGIKLTDTELVKNKYFRGEMKVSDLLQEDLLCDTYNYCIINGDGEIFKCSYALTVGKSYGNVIQDKEVLASTMNKGVCPFEYCGYEQAYLNVIDEIVD